MLCNRANLGHETPISSTGNRHKHSPEPLIGATSHKRPCPPKSLWKCSEQQPFRTYSAKLCCDMRYASTMYMASPTYVRGNLRRPPSIPKAETEHVHAHSVRSRAHTQTALARPAIAHWHMHRRQQVAVHVPHSSACSAQQKPLRVGLPMACAF